MDENGTHLKNKLMRKKQQIEKKPIRVWMDGCFDMVHFGHSNAFRQAKEMGDYLIVGVHTDDEITRVKGPPVSKQQERYKLIRANRWVDEVVEGAPYGTTLEILNRYNMDFCVHGDDLLPRSDGSDPYEYIRKEDRLRVCKRTNGISTTDLVHRMLATTNTVKSKQQISPSSPCTGTSDFVLSTDMIRLFSSKITPKPGDRVVYVDGSFDLFHVGHVEFLQKAALQGEYLILGLHDDETVKKYKEACYPIMTLRERLMGCLACKFVSNVVIGAPHVITEEYIQQLKIDVVVHGRTPIVLSDSQDPYAVPKHLKKFTIIDSGDSTTTESIVQRVINKRSQFEQRNKKKEEKELWLLKRYSDFGLKHKL